MNQLPKIEKNIPLPSRSHYAGAGITDLLKAMKVGDSVVLQEASRNTVYSVAKFNGIKVAIRKISDGEVRVWRIK